METSASTRSGSRPGVGSRFVLGGILALLVILGMLAMHGVILGGGATSQSTTAHVPATHGTAMHGKPMPGAGTSALGVSGHAVSNDAVSNAVGDGTTAALPCANCAPDELSMAANCLAAVVLAFLLLLPRVGEGRLWQLLRAEPQARTMALPPPSAPSLKVLCINRS